jgi:[ribosomal protein S5]-alanine N-acetyltransferase
VLNLDWRPPTLTTPRLTLRPIGMADAADIFLYCSNPNMTRFTLWNTHETLDDTLLFIHDYPLSRYPNREPDPIGIVLNDDPTRCVIGNVGCFWASRKDGVMELGYNLAEPYWGRGIIVEAARTLFEYVFREYPALRIQARVLAGNTASARVARKLGMTYEGTLRSLLIHRGRPVDVEFFALLRSEWRTLDSYKD